MNEVTCTALGTCGPSINVVLVLHIPKSELPRTLRLPSTNGNWQDEEMAENPFIHSFNMYLLLHSGHCSSHWRYSSKPNKDG